MKRISNFLGIIVILIITGSCSEKYFHQHSIAPGFDKSKTYSVAIMPVIIKLSGSENDPALKERAYQNIAMQLQNGKIFNVKDKGSIDKQVRLKKPSGIASIDNAFAIEIAKDLNCQLVAICELSTQAVDKGGLPILAFIQLINTETKEVVYMGRARADNPVSVEAGAEFAIERALKPLIN